MAETIAAPKAEAKPEGPKPIGQNGAVTVHDLNAGAVVPKLANGDGAGLRHPELHEIRRIVGLQGADHRQTAGVVHQNADVRPVPSRVNRRFVDRLFKLLDVVGGGRSRLLGLKPLNRRVDRGLKL